MKHELMKEPKDCRECGQYPDKEGTYARRSKRELAVIGHVAAQDRAIAQAAREAAGEENPVAWGLRLADRPAHHIDGAFRAGCAEDLGNALRRIVGQKESA